MFRRIGTPTRCRRDVEWRSDPVKTRDRFQDSAEAVRFKRTEMVTVMVTGAIRRFEREYSSGFIFRLYFIGL
jgi:hypothetical protein